MLQKMNVFEQVFQNNWLIYNKTAVSYFGKNCEKLYGGGVLRNFQDRAPAAEVVDPHSKPYLPQRDRKSIILTYRILIF
jgi:hypothetical protein